MKYRKAALVLPATALLLSLAACGGQKSGDTIELGDCTLKYKSAYVVVDQIGEEPEEALVLTFDFTNNTDEPISYVGQVSEAATQNGDELQYVAVIDSSDPTRTVNDSQLDEVQPGQTIEVATAFVLRNSDAAVKVELSQLSGSKGGTLTVEPGTLEHKTITLEDVMID